MSNIWVPDNMSGEELDLFIEIEYLRLKLRMDQHKHRYLSDALVQARQELQSVVDNVKFLKKEALVVSMKEFSKVRQLLDKAKEIHRDGMVAVAASDKRLKSMTADLRGMELRLDKLQSSRRILSMDGKHT